MIRRTSKLALNRKAPLAAIWLGLLAGDRHVFAAERDVRYEATVIPLLTKIGCNAGSCHGKATGQGGFRLSLFGSRPLDDWQVLVDRVDRADPKSSLLLQKPSGQIAHGGGTRLPLDSPEFRQLSAWALQVAQQDRQTPSSEPRLDRLRMIPDRIEARFDDAVLPTIVASFDDGSEVDVTRLARWESTNPGIADVDPDGRVKAHLVAGDASILGRYANRVAMGKVSVRAESPSPWPVAEPEPTSFVDRLIEARLKRLGLAPAETCSDAEFARRSSLDILGELPTVGDVKAFESDRHASKRRNWVDRLLRSPRYADWSALRWSIILRNHRSLGDLSKPKTFGFHAWLRDRFARNDPYPSIVHSILTAKGDSLTNPPAAWFGQVASREERTDDAAQVFLGVRVGCARCHQHPSERWSTEDYRDFSAFFARVQVVPSLDRTSIRVFDRRPLELDPQNSARPLRGLVPDDLRATEDPRRRLVDWMVDPANPYFARAVANRYWKQFMGRGLVEPEDDLRDSNPADDPELLDALADDFRRNGADLKHLIATITTSRAYSRSSRLANDSSDSPGTFARFLPRRIPAEALLDAIDRVAGTSTRFDGVPTGTLAVQLPDDGFVSPTLDTFGRTSRRSAGDCNRSVEPSLSHPLMMLTSAEIEAKLTHPDGAAARWARSKAPDQAKVDELYRVALSRLPDDSERAYCVALIGERRKLGRLRTAYEDLIWAMINTKEFLYNH